MLRAQALTETGLVLALVSVSENENHNAHLRGLSKHTRSVASLSEGPVFFSSSLPPCPRPCLWIIPLPSVGKVPDTHLG